MRHYPQESYGPSRSQPSDLTLRAPLTLKWTLVGGVGDPRTSPRGILFRRERGRSEHLVCLDHDGRSRWTRPGSYYAIFVTAEGITVAKELRGRTVSEQLDWADGSLVMATTLPGGLLAVHRKRLIARVAGAEELMAVNPGGGIQWQTRGSAEDHAPVEGLVASDGARLFVARGASVQAVSLQDGKCLWSTSLAPWIDKRVQLGRWRPFVSRGTMVIGHANGTTGLAALTGEVLWHQRHAGATAVSGDEVVVLAPRGAYVSLRARSGEVLCKGLVRGLGQLNSRIAIAGRHLWTADSTGRVIAVDRERGEIDWDMKIPRASFLGATPVIAGGCLFINTYSLAGIVGKGEPPTVLCFAPTRGRGALTTGRITMQ